MRGAPPGSSGPTSTGTSRLLLSGGLATGWFGLQVLAGRSLDERGFGLFTLATTAAALALALVARSPRGWPGSDPRALPEARTGHRAVEAARALTLRLDRLLIPFFVDLPMLGFYAAAANFLFVFDLLGVGQAEYQRSRPGRTGEAAFARAWLAPLGLVGLGLAVLVGVVPAALHLFFSGRFDASAGLLLPLAAVASLRMLQAVPGGLLAARPKEERRGWLLHFEGAMVVLQLALLFLLLPMIGLMGAVLANGVIAALRLATYSSIARRVEAGR
ncbi:MAG: hypothetical protein P1V51_04240 [Deltaproteobacteria bacterium]|nr:hypothetical protein [Deltaproteobacteria bacterium]